MNYYIFYFYDTQKNIHQFLIFCLLQCYKVNPLGLRANSMFSRIFGEFLLFPWIMRDWRCGWKLNHKKWKSTRAWKIVQSIVVSNCMVWKKYMYTNGMFCRKQWCLRKYMILMCKIHEHQIILECLEVIGMRVVFWGISKMGPLELCGSVDLLSWKLSH